MKKILKAILYGTLITLPFGELLRFTLFTNVSVRILDIFVVLIVTVALLYQREKYFAVDRIGKSFLILSGILIISHLVSLGQSTASSRLYLVRTILYLQLPIVFYHVKSLFHSTRLNKVLIIVSLISMGGAIGQYFLYPPLQNLQYLGYDPHYFRAVGFILDPNLMGIIFVFILLYSLNVASLRIRSILIAIALVGLILTFSRISIMSLGVALLFLFLTERVNKKLIICIVSILAFGLLFIPKQMGEGNRLLRTASIGAKVYSWDLGLSILKLHPLGVGFNNSQFYKPLERPRAADVEIRDNSYFGLDSTVLTLLVTTSFAGVLAYIYVFLCLVQSGSRIGSVLAAAFLFHSFSTNSFFTPTIFVFFLFYYFTIQPKSP